MKNKAIVLLLIVSTFSLSLTIDVADLVSTAIREGNSKNISAHFIERIDLKVIEKEDVYSKEQAEMILKDFFSKHPVKSFSIAHKSEPKNGSQYFIGTLTTTNGVFRINFLSKTTDGKTLIQQFSIETAND